MTDTSGPRAVHLPSLIALVVANMVGTGIFTSLGFQLVSLRSPFVLMALWTLGGLLAFCGALCYAELGASLRRSGGEYHFLTRIYGRPVGFLAGWVSATAGFAAPIALAAMAFGSYLHRLYPPLPARLLAALVVGVVTWVHLMRPTIGLRFQNSLTTVKVIAILGLIAVGLWRGNLAMSPLPAPGDTAQLFSSPFAISLVFVMYAYSGWNAATYVISEVDEPQRNIPRSLLYGTGLVTLLYLGLTWTFLRTTPAEQMVGQTEVGLIAARSILGERLGSAMGALIAVLLLSTISAMVRIGPRVLKVMGEDHPSLAVLAGTNTSGIPTRAVLMQSLLSLALVATGTFDRVLVYAQFSLLACTFLAAFGVLLLRWREPALPRPFRVWGHPVTTLLFLTVTMWMMVFVVRDKPFESLMGLGTLAVGLVVYLFVATPLKSLLPSSVD